MKIDSFGGIKLRENEMRKKSKINIYKHCLINKNVFHTLSPRYDSSEECRVSYSIFLEVFMKRAIVFVDALEIMKIKRREK